MAAIELSTRRLLDTYGVAIDFQSLVAKQQIRSSARYSYQGIQRMSQGAEALWFAKKFSAREFQTGVDRQRSSLTFPPANEGLPMPKRPVTVGSVVFDSVGRAKAFIQTDVVAAYDGATRIPSGPIHEFLEELLHLHEEATAKIGVGIDYFRVDPASSWKVGVPVRASNRALVVVRTDGTAEDWSWTGIVTNPSAITQVRSALRNAAYDSIQTMKRDAFAAGPVMCARTGVPIGMPSDLQIRHYSPSFAKLTDDYAASVGGWGAIGTMSTGAGAEIANPAIEAAWISYFVANAVPSFESK
jgi:hypothetical protein